jgi:hypothetical protein
MKGPSNIATDTPPETYPSTLRRTGARKAPLTLLFVWAVRFKREVNSSTDFALFC